VLWLLSAQLRQLRMVVADVEPLGFPITVQLYQLIHLVLVRSISALQNANSSDYSRIAGAGLWLHSEELAE
jgi:hypothetical protein